MDRFVHEYALKLQARFAGRIGDGADGPVLQGPAAVEDDALDAFFDRPLGDCGADRFGAFEVPPVDAFRELALERRIDRGRRHERLPGGVVDDLRVDVRHAAKHAEARTLLAARNPLALPQLNADATIVLRLDLHA